MFDGHIEGVVKALVTRVIFVAILVSPAYGQQSDPRGIQELKRLRPHLKETCALVREDPSLWPLRSFPYGPLGLEVRRGSASDSDRLRNLYLGMAAAACGVPADFATSSFFCGPQCPKNRYDHLVHQMENVREALAAFEALRGVRLVSLWAPEGESRVTDVFVLDGTVREVIPSPMMGLVPSGDWRPWPDLASYLATVKVNEADIQALVSKMLGIGLTAFVREAHQVRAVAVGVGDNESGLLFVAMGGSQPQVGEVRSDGSRYQIVQQVAKDIFFYETT